MKLLKMLVFSALLFNASNGNAEQVSFSTADKFTLQGSYYKPKAQSQKAVLMLHQCNFNRTMYEQIGQGLAVLGIHALSIDLRGFGDSATDAFDMTRADELSAQESSALIKKLYKLWPSDAMTGLEFLQDKVGANGKIGVIGTSCGGSLALKLSASFPFSAVILLSSAQGEKNTQRYEHLLQFSPTLLIASVEDEAAYQSAQKLFGVAKHVASKFLSYTGDAHGHPLFKQDPLLQSEIVNWLAINL